MDFRDSETLRLSLQHLFPNLSIEAVVPTPSSQRIVYFCSFEQPDDELYTEVEMHKFKKWSSWGSVVLKVSQNIHPKVVARLEKEIEILNDLNSVYFPTLYYYDVFSEDPETEEIFEKSLFITIEDRIDGDNLSNCTDQFSDEDSIATLLYELTEGLKILWNHKQKIVHRDLKPDNIIIRDNGKPVIIDLGIIREEGSVGLTATRFNSGPCSPAYASPEQAKNDKKNINFRSDFFALGIIGYELMTGSNPFVHSEDDIVDDVFEHVIEHELESLYSKKLSTEAFSVFIEKLLKKEPFQRFRTVQSMQDALKCIVRGEA